MARSSTRGRRPGSRDPAPAPDRPRPGAGQDPAPSLAAATLPRVWQGIGYRPLPDAAEAHPLFDYAAVPWPADRPLVLAWGAHEPVAAGERLMGAVVAERSGDAMMLHGPVVVAERDPLEVASQLVAAVLDHATAAGALTVFARPEALDRIWVRHGFIPVPESTLPEPFAGRGAVGLYAWRGGSALWTLRESARS
ncbi:MAG: hypothetical protein HYR86_15750 [Candidatus Rokubacteria bacterium]|nr:hypothetical protein [Candidatus Rokubacteria bacterium]